MAQILLIQTKMYHTHSPRSFLTDILEENIKIKKYRTRCKILILLKKNNLIFNIEINEKLSH